LAEAIPSTVGAVETDAIAIERVEEVEDVEKIGEVSRKMVTDLFVWEGELNGRKLMFGRVRAKTRINLAHEERMIMPAPPEMRMAKW
jgi:hypothetical protein